MRGRAKEAFSDGAPHYSSHGCSDIYIFGLVLTAKLSKAETVPEEAVFCQRPCVLKTTHCLGRTHTFCLCLIPNGHSITSQSSPSETSTIRCTHNQARHT